MRCNSKTLRGTKCKNNAKTNSTKCSIHSKKPKASSKSIKVGDIVKIHNDLASNAKYHVLKKLKGDKTQIMSIYPGEDVFDVKDKELILIPNMTLEQARADWSKRHRGE